MNASGDPHGLRRRRLSPAHESRQLRRLMRPVNIRILIRFSCLFGSFDMATDDTCFVFNSISDVTLATVDDEISLTLEARSRHLFLR